MITINGGAFQDASGNPLASGKLVLQLSTDAQETTTTPDGQVVSGLPITIVLDANGDAPNTSIFSNAELNPAGTYYTVRLFSSSGQHVWSRPQIWVFDQAAASTVDIGTMVPSAAGSASHSGAVQTNPVGAQTVSTYSLAVPGGVTAPLTGNVTATTVATQDLNASKAGVFTNTQMNHQGKFILNGADPASEFFDVQGNYATEGVTGAIEVPASATVYQADAVAGYITNEAPTNAVAVYGHARSAAAGASVWGGNFLVHDFTGSGASKSLHGVEVNVNTNHDDGNRYTGVDIVGGSTLTPASSYAIWIRPIGVSGNFPWAKGIYFDDSSAQDALNIGTAATGNGTGSMPIQLRGRDAGGGETSGKIELTPTGIVRVTPHSGMGLDVIGYSFATGSGIFQGGVQTGTDGTLITQTKVYTPSITPASVAAATVAEQTFTVAGLTTADKVVVNPPAITNATGIAGARVSAADTLAIRFVNPTAGALTPDAGTYTIIAIRS
jgi:hypothetical protein